MAKLNTVNFQNLGFKKPILFHLESREYMITNVDVVNRLFNNQPNLMDAVEAGTDIQELRALLNPKQWTLKTRKIFDSLLPDVDAAFKFLNEAHKVSLSCQFSSDMEVNAMPLKRSRTLITAVPRRFHYRITRRTVLACGTFGFLQNGPLYPLHAHLRGGV